MLNTSSYYKLADDILERMRIKKVLLKTQGKRWEVLAEINPFFVIMSGSTLDEKIGEIIQKKTDDDKGKPLNYNFYKKFVSQLVKRTFFYDFSQSVSENDF